MDALKTLIHERLSWAPHTPSMEKRLSSERRYLLERVDDAAVVQLYADGFTGLPLREKVLVWHLYLAALAGRDIYYDQRHAHSLEMRALLEAMLTHGRDIAPAFSTRFAGTRSCSGSTAVRTTTSPRESSSCA